MAFAAPVTGTYLVLVSSFDSALTEPARIASPWPRLLDRLQCLPEIKAGRLRAASRKPAKSFRATWMSGPLRRRRAKKSLYRSAKHPKRTTSGHGFAYGVRTAPYSVRLRD